MRRAPRFRPLLLCLGFFVAVAAIPPAAVSAKEPPPGVFSDWTAETFARAKRERRIIVLMVSTTWCHWCHVMKRETYGNQAVQRALKARFLPILTDADHRPDLSERFRHYRWPTTAFLTPDAEPILALRGYRSPTKFLEVLADVRRRVAAGGPFPGFDEPAKPSGRRYDADDAGLRAARDEIRGVLDRYYDAQGAGWGRKQKYPVPEPVEYGLYRRLVDGKAGPDYRKSVATLRATEQLIDRAWGGVYQYSLQARWDRWHPEKIMTVNAGALANYAQAFAIDQDPRWQKDAQDVVRWLTRFMAAPGGGFYGTQDADAPRMPGERFYRLSAKARVPYGIPSVNRKLYAKDNAEAVLGLVAFHEATGDARLLTHAQGAMRRLLAAFDRKTGLRHQLDSTGTEPLHLVDHALAGRALLALDQADPASDGAWLDAARDMADAMTARFADPQAGGFFDVAGDRAGTGVFARRLRSLEPNAQAARFLLSLAARTSEPAPEAAARRAIRAVGTSDTIRQHWRYGAGLLLAIEQALAPYVHIKVSGDPKTPAFAGALRAARRLAAAHPHVTYGRDPEHAKGPPAFLLCGRDTCSDPITEPAKLAPGVRALLAPAR